MRAVIVAAVLVATVVVGSAGSTPAHAQSARPQRTILGMTREHVRDQVVIRCATGGFNIVSTDPSHIVCDKAAGILASALLTTATGPRPRVQFHVVTAEVPGGVFVTAWQQLQTYTFTGRPAVSSGMTRGQRVEVEQIPSDLHPIAPVPAEIAPILPPITAPAEELEMVARAFWDALLTRDVNMVRQLEASAGAYVEGTSMRPEAVAFFETSSPETGRRSVQDLASLGPVSVVIAEQSPGRAFVLFIPQQFADRVGNPEFLETRWLKDYYACEFHSAPSGWKLGGSSCFEESDGPYPADYG